MGMDKVEKWGRYGGDGEEMGVYGCRGKVKGKGLVDMMGSDGLRKEEWREIEEKVSKGGGKMMKVGGGCCLERGWYVCMEMIGGGMGGKGLGWGGGS